MTYQFEAGRIYRMPTHFGPAPGPRQIPDDIGADPKRSPRRLSVAARFLTDARRWNGICRKVLRWPANRW